MQSWWYPWSDSEFFFTKVKQFSEFDFTGKFWVFKLKMPFRLLWGKRKWPAIFFIPLLILLKKSSLLLFCKTRWVKGFYNISASVWETHSGFRTVLKTWYKQSLFLGVELAHGGTTTVPATAPFFASASSSPTRLL